MSDGGAGALVEGVSALAKFKVGRVVLWFVAAWLLLSAVTGHNGSGRGAGLPFFIGILCAGAALVGGFIASRRKRAERASLRMLLAVVGMVLAGLVGAILLIGRKRTPELAPPTEAEVDAIARERMGA